MIDIIPKSMKPVEEIPLKEVVETVETPAPSLDIAPHNIIDVSVHKEVVADADMAEKNTPIQSPEDIKTIDFEGGTIEVRRDGEVITVSLNHTEIAHGILSKKRSTGASK